MAKAKLLKQHEKLEDVLKKCLKEEFGCDDKEIEEVFERSYCMIITEYFWNLFCAHFYKLRHVIVATLSIVLLVIAFIYIPTSSILLRNGQSLAYPTLRLLRNLTSFLVKYFPSISDLYDETCILDNPYFYVDGLNCAPCQSVYGVLNVTGFEAINAYREVINGAPLTLKTYQPEVTFRHLQELFNKYPNELLSDSRRLQITNFQTPVTLQELLALNETSFPPDAHVQWRINKMSATRIIRKLFPRPHFFPDRAGQDVERFVFIDGPTAKPYPLPNTQCGLVFLIQGSGERIIHVQPTAECKGYCKGVKVHLRTSDILLYNWWYWKPISLPCTSTNLSISYLNSYCI